VVVQMTAGQSNLFGQMRGMMGGMMGFTGSRMR
jgi:hypothetical protein